MLSGLSSYVKNVKKSLQTMGNAPQAKAPSLGKVKIGYREVEEVKLLAQGGYAYVYKVKDTSSGTFYALKKMICQSPERLQTAKNELKMMAALPDHPNILKTYDSHVEQRDGCYYVYVLMEFCEGGSIFDLMEKYESTRLSENQIIFIMREVCEGVKALHSCNPPIAHRDLKIENVLLCNKKFKLCDFGSCSTSVVDFAKVPQHKYSDYEEEYDKNTTLMYRPPEMCDPYQKLVVDQKVDVWMIGCILYTVCFYKHPFLESSKLSIVNAAFTFPKENRYPEKIIDLIRIMLTPNPKFRPSIHEVCKLFENYFELDRVKLNPDAERIRQLHKKQEMEMSKFEQHHHGGRKFDGDIPVEELMKLQRQIQDDDDGYASNRNKGSNLRMNAHQNSDAGFYGSPHKQPGQKINHHHSSEKSRNHQVPEIGIQHFNSTPGNHTNDWYNFNESNKPQPANNNAGWNSNSNQQPKKDAKVDAQWQNFSFGGSTASSQNNNVSSNNNSNNNAWAFSGWNNQNQSQNNTQANSNNSSNNNSQNNFANFGFNQTQSQPQPQTTTVTNDLLDLADTKPVKRDTAAGIMALYS